MGVAVGRSWSAVILRMRWESEVSKAFNEFFRELSFGQGSTAPVGGGAFPAISTRELWNGKDGELPVEDDIDLSDVELYDLEKDEL
ncbi:hypothetical protein QTO34_018533 [Cnephaeus nilssonii]|uniref:Uncharacterized protein n=1 Tax=Cnephaeus nilssonii TaxID=3371016 RepID=A0AA40HYZ8_CNENI|nr:hypothetical protein QTO34_018533 [Eptesicus nilssonii]